MSRGRRTFEPLLPFSSECRVSPQYLEPELAKSAVPSKHLWEPDPTTGCDVLPILSVLLLKIFDDVSLLVGRSLCNYDIPCSGGPSPSGLRLRRRRPLAKPGGRLKGGDPEFLFLYL